jgi:hypothetical protein
LVLLEHHLFAHAGGAQRTEQLGALGRPLAPLQRTQERLEDDEAPHAVGVAGGVVHCERAAPVVADQDDVTQLERFEPSVEIAHVVHEAVAAAGFAGRAHADEVGRQDTRSLGDVGQHIAPDVR